MHIPPALFSTDLFWTSIKWLMIVIVWGLFAWGTWREDRRLRELLQKPLDEQEAVTLMRTLHRRDIQIWLQVSLLLVVVAANDIRHDASLLPPDFFAAPPTPILTPVPAETAAPTTDDRYEKVLKKNAVSGLPFSDITEFNEKNSKQEAYIDWLKERYESWMVTYYYLQKCKSTGTDDYDRIVHSLEKDLIAAHADGKVENNILTAAAGSYREMYSDIPCDSAHMAATKSMYDANMQQILSLPPQNSAPAQPQKALKAVGAR